MNVFDANIEGLPENPLSPDPIFHRAHEWSFGGHVNPTVSGLDALDPCRAPHETRTEQDGRRHSENAG